MGRNGGGGWGVRRFGEWFIENKGLSAKTAQNDPNFAADLRRRTQIKKTATGKLAKKALTTEYVDGAGEDWEEKARRIDAAGWLRLTADLSRLALDCLLRHRLCDVVYQDRLG